MIILLQSFPAFASDEFDQILVLHSYSIDYSWTEDMNNGILEVFERLSTPQSLHIEFMDTKRFNTPRYLENLSLLYADKYSDIRLDGIIAVDNNALDFVLAHGDRIFPGVPIVATGINGASPPMPGSNVICIVAEEANHLETIRQALFLTPDATHLYVIADATPTDAFLVEEVKRAMALLEHRITPTYLIGMDVEEIELLISDLGEDDLVYMLPFFLTSDETRYIEGQAEKSLTEISPVPIFASWDFQLNNGVVGGNIISARPLGRIAADTLVRFIEGESVQSFVVDVSSHEKIYDHEVVERYSIDLRRLPDDTRLINRPETFWMRYASVLAPALAMIVVLSLLVALLFMNLSKVRAVNRTNQRNMILDREIIETQKELVSTLGEVIEVRSQETGNHVQRVAKVSRLLGEKAGMDEQTLDLLEASSPLHDVGKIGIPESVLNKPGPLTPDEFERVKMHTEIGRDILAGSQRELLKMSREIAYQHHERWDGTGYPRGLKEEQTLIFARITAIADVYDAISSERVYKEAWPPEKVLDYIRSQRGGAFDPELVDIFVENFAEIEAIRKKWHQ